MEGRDPVGIGTVAGVLDGLRIVEIGRGLSAPVVGMLLAEQGAEVVRIVDPDRPPIDPVLDAILARGKIDATVRLATDEGRAVLQRLLARADAVIDDLDTADRTVLHLDFDAIRRGSNPGLIAARIPAFTDTDSRSGLPGYEKVVGAAGHLYEKPFGNLYGHDLPVASILGALFAANALVAALIPRLGTGLGQDIEVSRHHSALFAQILQILMKSGVPRGFLPLKMIGTPFMSAWKCGDGRYIYLHITLPAHAELILHVLADNGHADDVRDLRAVLSAETMADPSQVGSIAEAEKIRAIYDRIFLQRTAADWERVLGVKLCCIQVRTVEDWVHDSLAAGMDDACRVEDPVFGPLHGPGPGVTSPQIPQSVRARVVAPEALQATLDRWESVPSSAAGAAPSGTPDPLAVHAAPLRGVRVLDLSRIIAGPCSARILAELGADVVSVQNPTTLDWALSFHLMFNAGKRSVTLDSTGDEGKKKLQALIDDLKPDVLVQNYRHMDVARAVGVDPETIRKRFPDIVYAHLNAYGDRGQWKDRPGFEQVVQAVSGIQMTYGDGTKPKLLPTPVIDIGCGLTGAFATVLGLYHKARTGQGIGVSSHLTWIAVLFQVERVAAFQRDRCLAMARDRGLPVSYDPGREIVSALCKARRTNVCVAGPRADVVAWASRLDGAGSVANPLHAIAKRLRWTAVEGWQRSASEAGVLPRVVVMPVPRMRDISVDAPRFDPASRPVAYRCAYDGVEKDLTFVRGPMRLSLTPAVDIGPPPIRGGNTREVMARIGVTLPEGAGKIPYPANSAFLPWFVNLVRWGWFAWKSGNV